MEPEGVKRKLTTILAADVEGYSRLMSSDEGATLRTLKSYREIIDGLIGRHHGRIFGTGGNLASNKNGQLRYTTANTEAMANRLDSLIKPNHLVLDRSF